MKNIHYLKESDEVTVKKKVRIIKKTKSLRNELPNQPKIDSFFSLIRKE